MGARAVHGMTRREALAATSGALAGMLLHSRETTAAEVGQAVNRIPSWPTEMRQLAPNIYCYTQASGPGISNASLSNAGLIVSPNEVLAIDALGPPIHAKAFRAALLKTTGGRPVSRLVNTHHHRDHTNGNCFFTLAEIVSTEYCRSTVISQGIPARPYEERPEWQDEMNELKLAPPTTTIAGPVTYRYGALEVQLIPMAPGHTWGDLLVYIPQHRILFAADLAFYYVTPPAHNGHISGWIDAIDRINGMDVDVIVPGHGPVGTKKELADVRAYLTLIRSELRKRYDAGMSPGRAAADMNVGRFEAWTNPERNAWNAVRLWAEWNGTLSPAQDLPAQTAAVAEYTKLRAARG